MLEAVYIKPTKRMLFYPARRGRLGDSLRIALIATVVACLFVYAATQAGGPPTSLHGVAEEAMAP